MVGNASNFKITSLKIKNVIVKMPKMRFPGTVTYGTLFWDTGKIQISQVKLNRFF